MITLDQAGLGAMTTRIFAPPADLELWVEHSWIRERERAGSRPNGGWRIVPDASAHLIYTHTLESSRGGASRRHRLALVGARTVYADADVSRRQLTVGVRLRPGALPLLLRLPAPELTDRSVAVEEALGVRGALALERLAECRDAGSALREIVAFLRAELSRVGEIDRRVRGTLNLVAHRRGEISVKDAAHELGIGERTVRAVVRAETGLGPKRIGRIYRLYRALRLGLRSRRGGWARVAAAAGYHDQPHLIHDFRDLLGETPAEFVGRGCMSH